MEESEVLRRQEIGLPIFQTSTSTTQSQFFSIIQSNIAPSETESATATVPHETSVTPVASSGSESSSTSDAVGPPNHSNGVVGSSVINSVSSTIDSTTSTAGTTSPTATPNFAWPAFSTTLETCTTITLNWSYSGPQETIQLILVPSGTSLPPNVVTRKRASDNTTIAAGVDVTGSHWIWSQVNAPAGQYVVVALGDRAGAVSPPLEIINGTDTSCLVTARSIPIPNPTPTTSKQGSPNGAVLAGAIVAGILVGLVMAIGGSWLWKRSRTRSRELRRSDDSPRRGHGLASFVAARIPTLTGKRRPYPLVDVASNPPLISNRRPPSSLVSALSTPIPLSRQTHVPATDPFEDFSSVWLRSSNPSDVTSMGTRISTSPSTYLPSYATSLSTPPSYATEAPDEGSASHPATPSYGNSA